MPNFKNTVKQDEATKLLESNAKHILFRGGARSGKTFLFVRAMIVRALKEVSRHAIIRKHFAYVKQAVWYDTMPKVFELCFPGLHARCKFDKSDWFVTLPNRSELWIGGLDEKQRTEKILGKEYSTILFNECSQLTYESIGMALTRLSQKNNLKKRAYYDENPPKRTHWSHKLFIKKVDPLTETDDPIGDPENYATILMNPRDNVENLDPDYIPSILEKLPPRLRLRFLDGQFGTDDTDIFLSEWIRPSEKIPSDNEIAAKFTFIDPACTEKERATDSTCESAIITLGIDYNKIIHDIEVDHGFWGYQELKNKAKATYERHKNTPSYFFGNESVQAQTWLTDDLVNMGVPCSREMPDNDKVRRAISVTDLLEQGRCRINDRALTNQLLGFPGEKFKDLADAYVGDLKMIKRYSEDEYVKEVDKYKGLDSRSKDFWMNHYKQQDDERYSNSIANQLIETLGG